MPIDPETLEQIQRQARPLLESVKPEQRILIWGAGQLGTWLADELDTCAVGFLDSNPTRQGAKINGLSIWAPEQFTLIEFDQIWISVLSDPGSICHWLEEHGQRPDHDYVLAFPGGKLCQVLVALPRMLDFLQPLGMEGRRCLEVGSGGQPWLSLVLAYLGAKRVLTTDVTRRTAMPEPDEWAVVYDRLVSLAPQAWGAKQSPQILMERMDAESDPVSAERLPFTADSFDVVANTGVMEHVTDPARAFHEFARVLTRDGVAACLAIGIHDHRANDPRSPYHPWSFLDFSESEWQALGANAYHQNRWRACQFRTAMRNSGFHIEQDEARVDRGLTPEMCSFFDSDFQQFSLHDLAELDLWIAGRWT